MAFLRSALADQPISLAADTGPVIRSIHGLSLEHWWAHVPGATLIDGAAHLISPLRVLRQPSHVRRRKAWKAIAAQPGNLDGAPCVCLRADRNLKLFPTTTRPESGVDLFTKDSLSGEPPLSRSTQNGSLLDYKG